MSYANAYTSSRSTIRRSGGSGSRRTRPTNLVTPGITGLDNVNAMQAAYDVGIRYLVSDTSIDRAGQPVTQRRQLERARARDPRDPALSDRPRLRRVAAGGVGWRRRRPGEPDTRPTSRSVDAESRVLAGYLLRGANDPWMFHQANTRDFGGGHSLLGDLLGATIDRYLASATFPIVSPNMEELGGAGARPDAVRRGRGVSATIEAGRPGDGAGRERGADSGDRAVHAERGELRRSEDRVPRSPGGRIDDAVARRLQPAHHRNGRRGRGERRRRAARADRAAPAAPARRARPAARGATGAAGRSAAPARRARRHAGATGARGHSGSAGTTGGAGISGNAGTTGGAGISGNAGTTGGAGTGGYAGTTGGAGISGNGGTTGGASDGLETAARPAARPGAAAQTETAARARAAAPARLETGARARAERAARPAARARRGGARHEGQRRHDQHGPRRRTDRRRRPGRRGRPSRRGRRPTGAHRVRLRDRRTLRIGRRAGAARGRAHAGRRRRR